MTSFYIKRIVIEQENVYVMYYAAQQEFPTLPFQYKQAPTLTEIYGTGGRKALDRYVIEQMANKQYQLRGNHASIKRYRNLELTDDYLTLCNLMNSSITKNKVHIENQTTQLLDSLSESCSKGYRS